MVVVLSVVGNVPPRVEPSIVRRRPASRSRKFRADSAGATARGRESVGVSGTGEIACSAAKVRWWGDYSGSEKTGQVGQTGEPGVSLSPLSQAGGGAIFPLSPRLRGEGGKKCGPSSRSRASRHLCPAQRSCRLPKKYDA